MAVDTSNLSSNWKALQEKLKKQTEQAIGQAKPSKAHDGAQPASASSKDAATPATKRKALSSDTHGNVHPTKKPKLFSKTPSQPTRSSASSNPQRMSSKPPSAPQGSPKAAQHTPNGTTTSHSQPPSVTPGSHSTSKVPNPPPKPGQYISLDTEMVGTLSPPPHSLPPSRQPPHTYSILARVSLSTYDLVSLYDAYVLPPADTPIADYRTPYSGITEWHLRSNNRVTNPKSFAIAQKEVAELLDGRVLVGHDLKGDLAVLGLSHPRAMIRDTVQYPKFRLLAAGVAAGGNTQTLLGLSRREGGQGRKMSQPNVTARETGQLRGGKKPSLRLLAKEVVGWDIQEGEKGHDSVEDARAVMAVYKKERVEFDKWVVGRFGVAAVKKGKPDNRAEKSVNDGAVGEEAGDEDEEDEDANDGRVDRTRKDKGTVSEDAETAQVRKKKPKKKKKKKGKYRRGGG